MAKVMAANPSGSLPRQHEGSWGDLKAAYRLLSNPHVEPGALQEPHRVATWGRCREAAARGSVVLVVQDDTELDFSKRAARGSVSGMGRLGGPGAGRGMYQHTAMAVEASTRRVLGLLDGRWWVRDPEGQRVRDQTRRERQSREAESDRWAQAAQAVAARQEPWDDVRLVHVGDRGSDVWRFLHRCRELGHGFVVRAQHDRYADAQRTRKLREAVSATPVRVGMKLELTRQRKSQGTITRHPREARVLLRWTRVTLPPPLNDPRTAQAPPLEVTAIRLREDDLPEGVKQKERVDWMLLTDQPVNNDADALRVVGWYRQRWLIEEWHRCLKQGCRLEHSRLDQASDIQRLAAVQGVLAVRMLQVRDAADDPKTAMTPTRCDASPAPSSVGWWGCGPAETPTPSRRSSSTTPSPNAAGGWAARATAAPAGSPSTAAWVTCSSPSKPSPSPARRLVGKNEKLRVAAEPSRTISLRTE